METRAQNGNGSQPLLHSHHDSGRPYSGEPDPRDVLAHQVHVLSLDQIKAIRNTNEYTEPPTVAPRPGVKPLPRPQLQQKTERPPVLTEQQRPLTRAPHAPVHGSSRGPLSRSISTVSAGSRGSARTSTSSSSSEQRLLGPSLGSAVDGIIRAQPKPELKPSELKLPSKEDLQMHAYRCEDCGKCKCKECTYPRTLPSCWICDKQCLCSAQNVVDYGTCVCCVKGLFYHCSNDDEDNCADNPCSCSQSHCCTRWSTMGMVSLVLPCLWCYLPAKGCLKLCQGCYDQVNRPGCRCKHSNTVCCKVPSVPPRNLEKPT